MKAYLKTKKTWIAVAVVVIVFAYVLWSGQPAPEVTQQILFYLKGGYGDYDRPFFMAE